MGRLGKRDRSRCAPLGGPHPPCCAICPRFMPAGVCVQPAAHPGLQGHGGASAAQFSGQVRGRLPCLALPCMPGGLPLHVSAVHSQASAPPLTPVWVNPTCFPLHLPAGASRRCPMTRPSRCRTSHRPRCGRTRWVVHQAGRLVNIPSRDSHVTHRQGCASQQLGSSVESGEPACSSNGQCLMPLCRAVQYPCTDPLGMEKEGRLAFPSGGGHCLLGLPACSRQGLLAAAAQRAALPRTHGPMRRAGSVHARPRPRLRAGQATGPAFYCAAALPLRAGHTSLSFVLTVYACGYLIWSWHWRHPPPPKRLTFWQASRARHPLFRAWGRGPAGRHACLGLPCSRSLLPSLPSFLVGVRALHTSCRSSGLTW